MIKVNLQLTEEEGMTAMDLDSENKLLAIAGSKGHVRVCQRHE